MSARLLNFRKLANRYSIGAATAFSMYIAGAALSFAVSFLLARLIGAAGLGLYFLSVTSVDIFSTISRLGLDNAALKFVSIANASAEPATVATVYRKCLGIALLSAALMVLPAMAILTWAPIGGDHHADFVAMIPLLMVALVPITVLPIQTEAFKAMGHPGTSVFMQSVLPQSILLVLLAVAASQAAATTTLVVAFYAGAFVLTALLAFTRWTRMVKNVWARAEFPTSTLLRTSLPILIVSSLNLVMAWTDTLALGILSDTEQVAIYGVALRISATTAFVLVAINSVVAPQFAALHSSGRHSELAALARRGSFWTLVIASPLILAFLIFPAEILGLFGEQFEVGAWSLRLLALAQLVHVSTGQLTSLLIMTGHEKLMQNNMIFSAALNLAGNLLLVPRFGALGAATSTAVSIAAMKLIAWWIARQKLQINTIGHLNLPSSK